LTENKPPAIIESIKRKIRLYKTWIRKRTTSSLEKYKIFKNKLTAERLYYNRCFDDAVGSIKQTWKILKSIIGKQTTNSIKEISANNTTITDPVTIANKFNEYFTSVGKDVAEKIPKVSGSCCDYIKGNYPNTVFLNPVNKTEILDIIHGCSPIR